MVIQMHFALGNLTRAEKNNTRWPVQQALGLPVFHLVTVKLFAHFICDTCTRFLSAEHGT